MTKKQLKYWLNNYFENPTAENLNLAGIALKQYHFLNESPILFSVQLVLAL